MCGNIGLSSLLHIVKNAVSAIESFLHAVPAFSGTAGSFAASVYHSDMQTSPSTPETALWWPIFRDLRAAREALGLKAAHLNTLATLLSFLKAGDRNMIVFASNKTILDRLNGLCERSLQRHINALIERGLIRRQASTNGKRFRLTGDKAYGFDLKPLLAHGDAIAALAAEVEAEKLRRKLLRQDILCCLAQLQMLGQSRDEEAEIRRLLRRNVANDQLESMLTELQSVVEAAKTDEITEDMSGSDSQNVGHYQKKDTKDSFDDNSEPTGQTNGHKNTIDPQALKDAPPDCLTLAGWMGISAATYAQAVAKKGRGAVTSVLQLILSRIDKIRNPAGYFHCLLIKNVETLSTRADMICP